MEEGGYEIEKLTPVGYFIENGIAKKSLSFVYIAISGKQIGTSYEDDEKECEFEPVWYGLKDAVKVLEEADKNTSKVTMVVLRQNVTYIYLENFFD